ncbi:MAG: hypothetical protein AAB606_04095, partial [Patescibacteria group bacterium]
MPNSTDLLKQEHNQPFPRVTRGSCLVIGTPEYNNPSEPMPIDLVRAVLDLVERTRFDIRPYVKEEGGTRRGDVRARVEIAGIQQVLTATDDVKLGDVLHHPPLESA